MRCAERGRAARWREPTRRSGRSRPGCRCSPRSRAPDGAATRDAGPLRSAAARSNVRECRIGDASCAGPSTSTLGTRPSRQRARASARSKRKRTAIGSSRAPTWGAPRPPCSAVTRGAICRGRRMTSPTSPSPSPPSRPRSAPFTSVATRAPGARGAEGAARSPARPARNARSYSSPRARRSSSVSPWRCPSSWSRVTRTCSSSSGQLLAKRARFRR